MASYAKIVTGDAADNYVNENEEENYTTDVFSCAHRGTWINAPENSITAINASMTDYVSVDLKTTKEGTVVLFADNTVDRMCVDKNGSAVSGNLSDLSYNKLSQYRLRLRKGGAVNAATDEVVPTLKSALSSCDTKILILDFDLELFDSVYKIVSSQSAIKRTVFRINGNYKDVIKKLSSKEKIPETMIVYNGGNILTASKMVKAVKSNKLNMYQLGTTNQYSYIFKSFITKNFAKDDKIAFSMTNGKSGKLKDNDSGWDYAVSCGYNVIETDYPDRLITYIDSISEAKASLYSSVKECENIDMSSLSDATKKKFKETISNSKALLKVTASKSEISDAYYSINNFKYNASSLSSKDEPKFNISVGKIIAIALCFLVLVAAQIFLFKKRAGKKKVKEEAISKAEINKKTKLAQGLKRKKSSKSK